jgi:NADH-quinone oxidoreductase subunit F
MGRNPHLLIEGCLIGARTILSQQRLHLHPRRVPDRSRRSCSVRSTTRRLTGCSATSTSSCTAAQGAYICGEETALLDSLEGKRGQPRPRPPFPPIQGLYMSPTQINNVQTIATIPPIIRMGASEFLKIGPENSPGHRCVLSCPATS